MLILILLIIAFLFLLVLFPRRPKHVLNIYFGVPGSGKSTFAAYLTKMSLRESAVIKFCKKYENWKICGFILGSKLFKRSIPVYSNVPITGAYQLDARSDLGFYDVSDAKIIIDEAGIEYNNRDFKSFPKESIYFYKYHRHYKTCIDVFSQSYDDMDITLRRLAQNFYVVKKSLLPCFIVVKRFRRKISVNEQNQIADIYSNGIPIIDSKWVFCPPLWKMFNSYSTKKLPSKEFEKW